MGENRRSSLDSSHSDTSDSDNEVLTVSEAKGMLRDIMTLCERQPLKKKLAEVRAKAQGDPRAAMLTVVPMVVEAADEALARRAKNKDKLMTGHAYHGRQRPPPASGVAPARAPLLLEFLREAQFLVGADSSGSMKKDMAALRALLSPP